jgi:hypothetical protein
MVQQTFEKPFSNSREYRDYLILQGYKDLGWMNGWDSATYKLWENQKALEDTIDHMQWNRSGSDCTNVLHQNKVFCSVDMGD